MDGEGRVMHPPPHWSVDISFKDDLKVILLLCGSFMTTEEPCVVKLCALFLRSTLQASPVSPQKFTQPLTSEVETRSRIHERTVSVKFLSIILRVLKLEVPYTIFTVQTRFKSVFQEEGELNPLVEVTVNSKEDTASALKTPCTIHFLSTQSSLRKRIDVLSY